MLLQPDAQAPKMTSLSEAPLTLSAATTLAAGIVLIAILYHVTYGQRYKGKRLPPGPLFTLPLLGEGMELGLNVEHPVAFFYKRYVLAQAIYCSRTILRVL